MSALRDWLTGTFAGRALLLGVLIKSVTLTLAAAGAPRAGMLGALDTIGGASVIVGALIAAYRLWVPLRQRLLWRVRRRLTLSYVFIGFVPALLIIVFFLLCGLLLVLNFSAYVVQSRIRAFVDEAQSLARDAALDMQYASGADTLARTLARRQAGAAARYPDISYAVVSAPASCADASRPAGRTAIIDAAFTAGRWAHVDAPAVLAAWVTCAGYSGVVADGNGLAVRAVALPDTPSPSHAVVVDIPLNAALARQIQRDTGIEMGNIAVLTEGEEVVEPRLPRPTGDDPDPNPDPNPDTTIITTAAFSRDTSGGWLGRPLDWLAFVDYIDWDSGRRGTALAAIQTTVAGTYGRISAAPVAQIGNFNFGQILLVLLAVVGSLFLVIQLVAFGMGLALARSITGSVHALFVGTARVRQGDFRHRIAIRTRDQLGELAESFNAMTSSIEDLLQQKAEKERLEQELKVARAIQTSLLPQGQICVPGFAVTAHCEPAREVGGDYYDVLPIDERRIGVLVADVSGKGPSAALYMAELKGLMLSLVQLYRSPRALLIGANGILMRHLDPRSYITMIYAVLDLEARTLTYARAGHCPMLHWSAQRDARGRIQTLSASGLVLGLQLDNGEMFAKLLEEGSVPLLAGDLFVLYTDGITEATNTAGEWFGEERLAALVAEHGERPPDELRARILREIQAFVGNAPRHDDMTMVLLRVEEPGRRPVDDPGRPLHEPPNDGGAGL